jgi:hypothetical protein
MNKKILLYIILVIIAVIIIAPYLSKDEKIETQAPAKQTETKKTISTSKCDKLEDGGDKWRCYYSIAEEERTIEVCDKIPELIYKEDCYYIVALVKNDISICDQITNTVQNEICINNFEKWKNIDCSVLKGYDVLESNCLKHYGIMNDDLEICKEILVKEYKDSCIKHVTLNLQ